MFKKSDKVLVDAVVVNPCDDDGDVAVVVEPNTALSINAFLKKENVHKSPEWIQADEAEEGRPYIGRYDNGYLGVMWRAGNGWFDTVSNPLQEPDMVFLAPKECNLPVKLRESCDGCRHYEESTKSGKWISEGEIEIKADAYSSVCWKTKQFTPEPHLINGKHCDEE